MADYNPPTEDLPIFDASVFTTGDEFITQKQADKRYLRYPNAQGTENLLAINVNGTATFNSNIVCSTIEDLAGTLTLDAIGTTITGDTEIQGFLNMNASVLADRRIDMNNGEIHQVSLVHSQNNNDITIEGKGTGDVILKTGNTNRLTISETGFQTFQGGMTYNNATDTLTVGNISGASLSASAILVTSDNTAGTYYIPFSKTSGTGNKALFQDDTTGPLSYNPSTATLTTTNFAGTITVTNDGSSASFCPVVLSPSGTTGQKALIMDDISTFNYLVYRPNDGLFCVPRVDNGIIPIFDDLLNLNNGPFGFTYVSGGGAAYTINNAALGNQISSFGNARIGLLQIDSGGGGSPNQAYVNGSSGITTTNMGTISFGVVPLGLQTLNSITTANNANETYTHYAVGLSSGANTFNTTQNGFFWRNTTTTLNTNSWEFVINNVVKATATGTNLTGPLTGKWLRFDITAVNASTLSVRLTNLTDGVAFTPSNIAVSAGEQAQFSSIYMAVGADSVPPHIFTPDKFMGVDYVYMNNINTQLLQGIPQRSNTGASAR